MIIFIFYTLATLAVLLGLMFSYTYFGLHANKMYDLPKVCCACLSQTNNLKHVNNSASVDEELLSIFNYFMIDLNWSKSKYNVYICSECYLRLQEAYQFLKMCHQNNTTLQGYVATLGHSCSDLEAKHHSVMFVNAATIKCEINENVQMAGGELKDDSVKYPTYSANIVSSYSHHTSKMAQDDSKKPHRCMICNKGFNRRTYLDEHMRLHTGEKPFKCTECDKCFIRKTNLLQHKRVHTGKKPYKCVECEKCFIDRAKLVTHQRIHAGDKPFACTKCSKCFIDRSNLIKHERTHTGEKPFVCTVCSKCFSDRSSCARHKRSHESSLAAAGVVPGTFVEPHKCMICSQYFLDRAKLETHLRIHNGEKPYGCSVCDICFSVKSDLTAHLRIHTG